MKINSKGYEENLYTKGKIRTYTGIYVDVMNPTPEMFCIEDIAHALSQIPRFGGHLPYFYSVAAHSISCANAGIKERFELLMHDAAEAYLFDVPSPIKKQIPIYSECEDKIMKVLSEKFGFQYPFSKYVHAVDKMLLEYEWENCMINPQYKRHSNIDLAEKHFLETFRILSVFS